MAQLMSVPDWGAKSTADCRALIQCKLALMVQLFKAFGGICFSPANFLMYPILPALLQPVCSQVEGGINSTLFAVANLTEI